LKGIIIKAFSFFYAAQLGVYFGVPNSVHLVLVAPLGLLVWKRMLGLKFSPYGWLVLTLVSTSFLFSPTFEDVVMLLVKMISFGSVFLVFYTIVRDYPDARLYLIGGVWTALILDAFYRVSCYTPTVQDIIVGSLAYKTECTRLFSDSNGAGIAAVLLGSLLLFNQRGRLHALKYRVLCGAALLVLLFLSASKAAWVAAVCGLAVRVIESIKPFDRRIFLVAFGIAAVILTYMALHNFVGLDDSLDTKFVFFRIILESLVDEPLQLLFGRGYFSGASHLAGDAVFAHSLYGLGIGMFGLIGFFSYLALLVAIYSVRVNSLAPLVMILVLGLSYFPPLFEYFALLIAAYCGVKRRPIRRHEGSFPRAETLSGR